MTDEQPYELILTPPARGVQPRLGQSGPGGDLQRPECVPRVAGLAELGGEQQTVPGVGEKVAQVILAETGGDISRFPSAAHLVAWAGVAPAIFESPDKRRPSGSRHGNKWPAAMLGEAAGAVGG